MSDSIDKQIKQAIMEYQGNQIIEYWKKIDLRPKCFAVFFQMDETEIATLATYLEDYIVDLPP